MAILLLKIADPLEVNKITIKCISEIDEIMEYGNKCVALLMSRSLQLRLQMVLYRPLLHHSVPRSGAISSSGIHMNPYHMRMNIIANIRCAE